MPGDLFKLEKLKLLAYETRDDRESGVSPAADNVFTVMYNPTSVTLRYGAEFSKRKSMRADDKERRIAGVTAGRLSLDLVMDGTGVSDDGRAGGGRSESVARRVDRFLEMCLAVVTDTHRPRFLRVQWGTGTQGLQSFDCQLESVDIKYTSFDRNGAPLRVELATVFVEDRPPSKVASPDLSHVRTVVAGDTLPALCKAIYGSPAHYVRIARINGLDHFRALTPGQELLFPPFERGGKR